MIYLKQSTAGQEIQLPIFVDSGDGNTAETALTIANTDIKLWKFGATSRVNKNSGGATHMDGGYYYCVLDATDTNTVGSLIVSVHVSGALPVTVYCTVLPAFAYDALFTTDPWLVQITDSVPADGTIPTREQAAYMTIMWLMERAVSGTTLTVKKVDGSTTLMTFTVDDGVTPTSITRTT